MVLAGNSLGGTAAMRAAERDEGDRIAGLVPIAPAGLDMPTWFAAIQGAPLVKAMLSSPVPVPQATLQRAVGTTYRVLAFARPREADEAVVGAFTSHLRTREDLARMLATGGRLLPEIKAPFRLDRVRCPVLVVWGERDRMVFAKGAERDRRGAPGHQGRAAAPLRPLPPDRAARPPGRAAGRVPGPGRLGRGAVARALAPLLARLQADRARPRGRAGACPSR